MADWWKYDGLGFDEDVLDKQIEPHEQAALDAIGVIFALADKEPDKTLVIGAALRKIATVAQSRAQTVSLRSATVRRKS